MNEPLPKGALFNWISVEETMYSASAIKGAVAGRWGSPRNLYNVYNTTETHYTITYKPKVKNGIRKSIR